MKTIFSVQIEEFSKRDNNILYLEYSAYYETEEEAREDFEKQKSNFKTVVEEDEYWVISISECTIDENNIFNKDFAKKFPPIRWEFLLEWHNLLFF